MSSSDEEYDPNVDDNDISDSEDSEYESEDDIDVSYDPVMDKGWSVMPDPFSGTVDCERFVSVADPFDPAAKWLMLFNFF